MPRPRTINPPPSAAPPAIAVHCRYDRLADPAALEFNPLNDNQHPEEQIALLASLYRETGIRHPVIVSRRSGKVVAGEGRVRAARLIDGCMVPVVDQPFDSEEEELAFLTADNRLQELSERSDSGTAAILARIKAGNPAFNILTTGYSEKLIGQLLKRHAGPTPAAAPAFNYKPQFGVIVVCESEAAQEGAYNALCELGYNCKVVTT
jgi:hypothetical protein